MTLKCTMILGDCLDVMPSLDARSIAMAFADLPYATAKRPCSENRWDKPFSLPALWSGLGRLWTLKWSAVFTATQPFGAAIVQSNIELFKYDLVWLKTHHSSPFTAKLQPLRLHEQCFVFGPPANTYNPQMTKGDPYTHKYSGNEKSQHYRGNGRKTANHLKQQTTKYEAQRYPVSCMTIPSVGRNRRHHPTQKPVALLDWLIRTYSNPGDIVFDPVSGSGTTGVSALRNGRSVVCVEKEPSYLEASIDRVRKTICDGKIDAKLEVRN